MKPIDPNAPVQATISTSSVPEEQKKEAVEGEPSSKQPSEKPKQKNKPKNKNQNNPKLPFKYKKNTIYSDLVQQQKDSESTILLQCFRYIVKQKLV